MKRPRQDERGGDARRRARHVRGQSSRKDRIAELLKICLQKVCELQEDLQRNEEEHDPEAAGFAACAIETIRFLSAEGVPPDHPIVRGLTERLLHGRSADG